MSSSGGTVLVKTCCDPVRHGRSGFSRYPLTSGTVAGFNMPENTQSILRLNYTAQQKTVCSGKSSLDTAEGRNSSEISSLHSRMLCCMLIEPPVLYSHKKWIGFTKSSRQSIFDNLPPLWLKSSFYGPVGSALISGVKDHFTRERNDHFVYRYLTTCCLEFFVRTLFSSPELN